MNARARIAAFFANRRLALATAVCVALTLALGATLASAVAPVVTIEDASNVGYTTADVEGTVNPEGQFTTWRFQYISEAQFQENLANSLPGFEGANTGIEEGTEAEETPQRMLTGLQPDTTYHLRLQAENGDGQSEAVATNTFTTEEVAAPVVVANEATNVAYTTAKATGTVEIANADEAFNTSACRFEYVSQAEWEANGNAFPAEGAPSVGCNVDPVTGSGPQPVEVEAQLSGLSHLTVYHLRLLAANLGGEDVDEAPATFETKEVLAPAATIDPVSAITGTSAHFSGLVNPNAPGSAPQDPGFDSNWSFSCSPVCPGLSAGTVAADDSAHAVEVDAKGLQPNTLYTVTLSAENLGGKVEDSEAFTTATVPPRITEPGNTPLGQGEVGLGGFVVPGNSAILDCHYEYGPDASYGQSVPCDVTPPTDNQAHLVKAQLDGLTLGATYHYRLFVTSAAGSSESGDGTFVVRSAPVDDESCPNPDFIGSGFLPECRAWEMVSPPNKHGIDVMTDTRRTRISPDGDSASFAALGAFVDAAPPNIIVDYLSERSDDPAPGDQGWSTHAITPPQEPMSLRQRLLRMEPSNLGPFSEDLSSTVFQAISPLTDEPMVAEAGMNLYVQSNLHSPGGMGAELVTDCPFCTTPLPLLDGPAARRAVPAFADASPDLSHVVFQSRRRLTGSLPAPEGELSRVYEWQRASTDEVQRLAIDASGGSFTLTLDGQTTTPIAFDATPAALATALRALSGFGAGDLTVSGGPGDEGATHPYLVVFGGSRAGEDVAEPTADSSALSGGGATASVTTAVEGGEHVRLAGILPDGSAADLSIAGSQRSTTDFTEKSFQPNVVSDGSDGHVRVFWTRPTEDGSGPSPNSGDGDVYVRVDGTTTEQLNLPEPGAPADSFAPALWVGASPDGSRAFLTTMQALTPDAPIEGQKLYSYDTTKPASDPDNLTFIARTDVAGGTVGNNIIGTSRDGAYVYFWASGALVPGAGGDTEIYLWHEGELTHVSPYVGEIAGIEAVGGRGAVQGRNAWVTPDGLHLLFGTESGQGVLSSRGGSDYDHGPEDCTFGAIHCREYYLYDAVENSIACVSCKPGGAPPTAAASIETRKDTGGGDSLSIHISRPMSDDGRIVLVTTAERLDPRDTNGAEDAYLYDTASGRHRLLSSGRHIDGSFAAAVTPDGTDAFLFTRQRLSSWDVDNGVDLYDARIQGGFPEPPLAPPACDGETCQRPPLVPDDPTPSSSTLAAPGDPKPSSKRGRSRRCAKAKRVGNGNKGRGKCPRRKARPAKGRGGR